MIAAALVTLLSPSTDEVYSKFKRLGITDLYPSRGEIIKSQWVRWLRLARRHFVEVGISNSGWLGDPDFFPVLKDKLEHEVEVKIFFLDPRCQAAATRAREDSPRATIVTIERSIATLWEFRCQLSGAVRNRLRVLVYTCTPSSGTTWVDDFMIVTHYIPGYQNATSPAFVAKPVRIQLEETNLYQIYSANVRTIENKYSTELTDVNIQQYLPKP
jgi:hypothetical protein